MLDPLVTFQLGSRPGARAESAILAGVVDTKTKLVSVPRVIAAYSHCRSSPPVTRVIPVCTVPPWAEWPVTA